LKNCPVNVGILTQGPKPYSRAAGGHWAATNPAIPFVVLMGGKSPVWNRQVWPLRKVLPGWDSISL